MQAPQSDPLSTATMFATAMVAMSVAAERVTETVKQWICPSLNPSGARNAAIVQTIAVGSGIFVAALSGTNPLKVPNFVAYQWGNHVDWMVWILTGFLVSGGSAVWNHLLDILQAAKVQKELTVYGSSESAPASAMQPGPVTAVVVATGD